MTAIKINIEKPIQQFEIAGNVYELPYDDVSLQNFMRQMRSFQRRSMDMSKKEFEDMTEEEQKELEAASLKASKELIEVFFGKGSYDAIYASCGKSVYNLFKVIEAVGAFLEEKSSSIKAEKRKTYTKRK